MKRTITLMLFLVLLSTRALYSQYFQHRYETNLMSINSLEDGQNVVIGANGHFLMGIGPSGTLIVQRTDIDGETPSTFPYFNKSFQISELNVSPVGAEMVGGASVQLSNGDFAIAGGFRDPSHLGSNEEVVYLVIMDQAGSGANVYGYKLNTYESGSAPSVTDIIESDHNGNIYICGWVANHSFVIAVDALGGIVWANLYDLNVNDDASNSVAYSLTESVNPNSNGIYELLVVGQAQNSDPWTDLRGFILRLNNNTGAILTTVQLYGDSYANFFTSIKRSGNPNVSQNGDGYVLGGNRYEQGQYSFWHMAIDNSGTVVWSNAFNTNSESRCEDMIERHNTVVNPSTFEYYLVGHEQNLRSDILVIKADENGDAVVSNGYIRYGDMSNDFFGVAIDQFNNSVADGLGIYGFSLNGQFHHLVKAYFNGITACDYDLNNNTQEDGGDDLPGTTAGIIDYFVEFDLEISEPVNGSDMEICYEETITGGDNSFRVMLDEATTNENSGTASILYPNPVQETSQELFIKIESGEKVQTAYVVVVDMLGRKYYSGTVAKDGNGRFVVPESNLSSGKYLVRIVTEGRTHNEVLLVK